MVNAIDGPAERQLGNSVAVVMRNSVVPGEPLKPKAEVIPPDKVEAPITGRFKQERETWRRLNRRWKQNYYRDADYWDFWDETIWNPGPFMNRNKNNILVALLSGVISITYISLAFYLEETGQLRHVQDETQYRTKAKLNLDLIYVHYFNIILCLALAMGTFYFEGTPQRAFMIGWLVCRPLLWLNSVRNFHLFLMRPHAYVIYNPANPEWRWQFISSHISYWVTVFYWSFHVISWVYEWVVVATFYYFVSQKSPITTSLVPNPLHRIKDSALTEPCDPIKDFTLLCPTSTPWKNPNNKSFFYHPPLSMQTDNRTRRIP